MTPEELAVVDPANAASVRVIEKLRMRREGAVRGLSAEHKDYEGHSLYAAGRGRASGESNRAWETSSI